MNTGWNRFCARSNRPNIINLLGNEYWLEPAPVADVPVCDYKPTGK